MTRREFMWNGVRMGAFGLLSASGLSLTGCGGSMGSSASEIQRSGLIGYGNANVEIQPTQGGATTGGFEIESASPVLRVGEPIFLLATYYADIRGVNNQYFTGPQPQPVGTFSAVWSEVLPSPTTPQTVVFNTNTGQTFTGAAPAATPNVRLSGESGTFIRVLQPGTVTVRITIDLQLADGSHRSRSFDLPLTIVP